MANLKKDVLDCGVALFALPGQSALGDRHVIRPFEGGALVAVVDGIGHGGEAGAAASQAVDVIEALAGLPVIKIIQACHDALRRTRGVVMSLASFNAADRTMTWSGVGNVEGLLLRSDGAPGADSEMLLLRAGVVGHNLPRLSAAVLQVESGDTLILATDGIGGGFWRGLPHSESPQRLSNRILSAHATQLDDALVVAARFFG